MTTELTLYVQHNLHVSMPEFCEILARRDEEDFIWWMMSRFHVVPNCNIAVVVDR